MYKSEDGFTLIEMLIVLMIITLLLILSIPNITKYNDSVEEKSCEAYEDLIKSEVQLYKIDHGRYPTELTQLDSIDSLDQHACLEGATIENGEVNFNES
ncbi:competence type IV pilus major pilin ComGC [Piscibacillus halophilus]|uniref:ComG operon protein 3 n=1 Tax=Piscibacillus halophilus TaxID=571933 RepID=A0A1H9ACY2_9BACI|nr:competence type IV pilus major pilin ComGC [Piscibacillus halophilus]SEP74293.1 competence protein ComGC [Piscibacillus halophilus]